MEVVIEIDGVRHKLVETDDVVYCNGACGIATSCSLRHVCIAYSRDTKYSTRLCDNFPREKTYSHFEIEK